MKTSKVMECISGRLSEEAKQTYRKKDAVRFIGEETGSAAEHILKWKTIDYTNYVHRVTLTFSCNDRQITEMRCSCGASGLCIHRAAALIRSVEDHLISYEPTSKSEETNEKETIPLTAAPKVTPPVEEKVTIKKTESVAKEAPYIWDGEIREMKVLLGQNTETGEDVYWYPNDTERVFHTNTGIIGTMGTGKTQFTKSLVTQVYREQRDRKNFDGHPYHVLIFDYKGDYNEAKPEFVNAVDAKIYKPYRLPYNPFALIPGSSFRPLLPVHTANVFKDTLTKSFRLGPKQQQFLLDCILEAYDRCGIMAEDPGTWNRTAPTFRQIYDIFIEKTENKPGDSLSVAMSKLYQFHIFSDDPRNTISISQFIQGVTVLDLSGYDSDIQSFVVAITLDQFYAQMLKVGSSRADGRYRQLNTLILVDEADNFMRDDFASLRKIMKEGREFGVGMVLSTQSLDHFIGGEDDYSRYILTWIVHNVSDLSQREVEYIYKLPPKSQEILDLYGKIKSLAKHESILKIANAEPEKIRDKAFFELLQDSAE